MRPEEALAVVVLVLEFRALPRVIRVRVGAVKVAVIVALAVVIMGAALTPAETIVVEAARMQAAAKGVWTNHGVELGGRLETESKWTTRI